MRAFSGRSEGLILAWRTTDSGWISLQTISLADNNSRPANERAKSSSVNSVFLRIQQQSNQNILSSGQSSLPFHSSVD
jgi:hypothetical protein